MWARNLEMATPLDETLVIIGREQLPLGQSECLMHSSQSTLAITRRDDTPKNAHRGNASTSIGGEKSRRGVWALVDDKIRIHEVDYIYARTARPPGWTSQCRGILAPLLL
jgi:hypothetical protein